MLVGRYKQSEREEGVKSGPNGLVGEEGRKLINGVIELMNKKFTILPVLTFLFLFSGSSMEGFLNKVNRCKTTILYFCKNPIPYI